MILNFKNQSYIPKKKIYKLFKNKKRFLNKNIIKYIIKNLTNDIILIVSLINTK